jgi:hypothetical protein
MPSFFTEAADQLIYLNPEPDRWRSGDIREMDEAWKYDHYVDLENVPAGGMEARDRFEFIGALYRAGIENPQQTVGFLPFRLLEMVQRLTTEFAIWRNMEDGPERVFVEARILNDAGILGHYATDASNPHHTTIHFNGWAEGVPNPEGYTTSRDFHSRFESGFVGAHLTEADVGPRLTSSATAFVNPREAIWEHVRRTNRSVEELYRLEMEHGFDPYSPPHPAEREFVATRLAAGAEMLRDLWWSAWVNSQDLAAQRRARGWVP